MRSMPQPSTATVRPPAVERALMGGGVDAAGEAGDDGGARRRRGRGPGRGPGRGRPGWPRARPTTATLRSPSSGVEPSADVEHGRRDRRCAQQERGKSGSSQPDDADAERGGAPLLVLGPAPGVRRCEQRRAPPRRGGRVRVRDGRGRRRAGRGRRGSRAARGARPGQEREGEQVERRGRPPFLPPGAPKGASLYGRPPACQGPPRAVSAWGHSGVPRPGQRPGRGRARGGKAPRTAHARSERRWHPPCFWPGDDS